MSYLEIELFGHSYFDGTYGGDTTIVAIISGLVILFLIFRALLQLFTERSWSIFWKFVFNIFSLFVYFLVFVINMSGFA